MKKRRRGKRPERKVKGEMGKGINLNPMEKSWIRPFSQVACGHLTALSVRSSTLTFKGSEYDD
jgi:hypothetical protein